MGIDRIGESVSQTAGYEAKRAQRNAAGGNAEGIAFADRAAYASQTVKENVSATLHGAEEGSGDIALSSWADVVSGTSISVYKPADFDMENPVYKVKIWNKEGNVTERMIDVSEVNPKNCDTAQFYAYTMHLKESGKGSFEETVLKAVTAKAEMRGQQGSSAPWDFSEKTDWVQTVKDIMQSVYSYGDLKSYMEWKKFLGFLEE